ncbi:surfeit locus protein 6 [Dioscorea cayenensis subsp. rotundata]|uniref:Surfeit locus protein 6 n=1 Tax=Dioscorea cayennensis subsp. rotundata TaxID=55577 RepID=A0AB40AS92_DIOCR|nr:surfeit locus protein 6 [Dioscorea cayenensis subsp. rotundata]XP_039117817.1 surfeit locus protein 6 [Dioscorea cayenensis subsp. rotundata]XP_039117818.1 surfeit locus protein 6 [Dioscorea cayenensis subsp. rotundata]XP_039117819.1 surfeit locus protein 6 [Dioscorea cayenensis subsp. rotundata]XP_039117820.1 surfeit locus protein 6 [Dioscorea cayenensis subsp. rotundata]
MKQGQGGSDLKESSSPAAVMDAPELDVKAMIHSHCLFFDRLVELIPARFYLPAPEDKPWFQGLSKAAKASAKRESRENLKKARRARHDPSSPSTTLDLLRKSIQPAEPEALATEVALTSDRAGTLEELRHRYRLKMEELRSNRNTKNPVKPRVEKEKKKKVGDRLEGKRMREERVVDDGDAKKVNKKVKVEGGGEALQDLSFSVVKIGDEEGKGKRRRVSKVKALHRAERLEEAKKDPEKGEMVAKNHSWKAAVDRAAGVKVHDDPKLLKESMKKERRKRQKHAEKWKERVQSRDQKREEKQKTRSDNIKERIQQKKMRKIEKREKKLMRPGFEGRREGYINDQ